MNFDFVPCVQYWVSTKFNYQTGLWDAYVNYQCVGSAHNLTEARELAQEFLDLMTTEVQT